MSTRLLELRTAVSSIGRLDLARPAIAARLGVTAEQVVFRWAEDVGMMPLTGTSSDVHMQQDLAAAESGLELSDDDRRVIETAGVPQR
jgi:diketogulonate reductase-like aldo/keto reductase